MSQIVNINDTVTFNPTGYTGATNFASENTTYPWSRGYNSVDYTTNYARLQLNASNTTTVSYIYYTFSVTGIPSNATITSVSCSVRVSRNSRVSNSAVQLYNGTTAKGSSTAFSSSQTTGTNVTPSNITNTGDWTVSDLQNIRLRISGQRSNTNNASYIYLWGSTLTVNYSVQGTNYEITSSLSTDAMDSIDPAGLTTVFQGGDYELFIYGPSIENIKVEDNGTDVTSSLVQHESGTSGTASSVAQSNFDTGFSSSDAQFYTSSSSTGTSNLEMAIGYTAESPNPSFPTSTEVGNYTYVKDNGSNTATGWIIYSFDFSSIPSGAVIESVSVKVYGCRENTTTDSTHVAKVGLYSGTTLKGAEQEFTSRSNGIMTINNVGTWTRAELMNAKLRFTVAYYGGRIGGITWTVNYSAPSENPYYWTYSLTNVSADHTIVIGDAIIEIPDEDPQYDYYPITISSINANTTPGRGTTRVIEGSNQTIEIYPSDPLITLITDNGVDVSSQLVAHGGQIPDPTVTTASGASYGFNLNQSTGYYVSANTGVSKTAAVCCVNFDLPVRCLVTIQFINYAEATYDFGVFGNIDVPLSNNYYSAGSAGATITDSNYKLACSTSQYNTSSAQTLTYEIPSGEHTIYVKYSKDDATDSNNDSLQFKVLTIEPLESNNYYTYTLSNVQQSHSLIFIFGDVTYYFVNSFGSKCKLFPSGSTVALPGDPYQLTVVPDDYSYSVTVTDNNVNVDSSVQRVEQEMTKEGNTYTVVNYIYTISDVQATHNINVTCMSTSNTFIKIDDRWTTVNKVYKKVSGAWVEQQGNMSSILSSLNNIAIFVG